MSKHRQKPPKEPYEKPGMVTEELEIGTLAYGSGSSPINNPGPHNPESGTQYSTSLIGLVQPFFGLCCG